MGLERAEGEDSSSEPAFFAELRDDLGIEEGVASSREQINGFLDGVIADNIAYFSEPTQAQQAPKSDSKVEVPREISEVMALFAQQVIEVDNKFIANRTPRAEGDERTRISDRCYVDKREIFASEAALTILELSEQSIGEAGIGKTLVVKHRKLVLNEQGDMRTHLIEATIEPGGHFRIENNDPLEEGTFGISQFAGSRVGSLTPRGERAINSLSAVLQSFIDSPPPRR